MLRCGLRQGIDKVIISIVENNRYSPSDDQRKNLARIGINLPYTIADSYTEDNINMIFSIIDNTALLEQILIKYKGRVNYNILNECHSYASNKCLDHLLSNYDGLLPPNLSYYLISSRIDLFNKYIHICDVDIILHIMSGYLLTLPSTINHLEIIFKLFHKKINNSLVKQIFDSIPDVLQNTSFDAAYPNISFTKKSCHSYDNNNAIDQIHNKTFLENNIHYHPIKLISKYIDFNSSHLNTTNITSYVLLRSLGIKPDINTFRFLCTSVTDFSLLEDCINFKLLPDEQCMINSITSSVSQFMYLRDQGGIVTYKVVDRILRWSDPIIINRLELGNIYSDKLELFTMLTKYNLTHGFDKKEIFTSIPFKEVEYIKALGEYYPSYHNYDVALKTFKCLSKYGLILQRIPSNEEIATIHLKSDLYLILLSTNDKYKDYIFTTCRKSTRICKIINQTDETKRYYQFIKEQVNKIELDFNIDRLINSPIQVDTDILRLLKLSIQ